MKVAMLCPRSVPMVVGGAERLWNGLVKNINLLTPHHAEVVGVDSPESTLSDIVHSYRRFDSLNLDRFDVVITGKYPAWMVKHRRKVVYMCHPLRGLYDHYPNPALEYEPSSGAGRALLAALGGLAPAAAGNRAEILALAVDLVDSSNATSPDLAFPGPLAKALVHWLDQDGLDPRNTSLHLAISHTVAGRTNYFPPGVHVQVVVPPTSLEGLHCGQFESLFTASRLDRPKRIDLIIDAMRFVTSDVKLRIAGEGPDGDQLRRLASADKRIQFLGRIDDVQLAHEYANAIAVPFVPFEEDLGLIAIEAQLSGKPVITTTDSGGAAELVSDGTTGLVVAPKAAEVGAALQRLVSDRKLARAMGEHGRERAARLSWASLVEVLLKPAPASTRFTPRPRVVFLSTYPAFPARHGGQVRVSQLCMAAARVADVNLICLGEQNVAADHVAPGVTQTTIRASHDFHQLNAQLSRASGAPAFDIAAALHFDEEDDFARTVDAACRRADAIVLAQPYLVPFVAKLSGSAVIIHDSQNAEWQLKSAMYNSTPGGRALSESVREIEAAALRAADLVTAVSQNDITALKLIAGTMCPFVEIPNGTASIGQRFVDGAARRRARDLFLHSLRRYGWPTNTTRVALYLGSGHPPNLEAAQCVLAAAAEMPDVLFILVGSHVQGLDGIPIGHNIFARGSISSDELDMFLGLCDVALNPMRTGSGTNIKMLDYLAVGAPIVSTEIGARGLGATPNVHFLQTTADGTAEGIRVVLADSEAADALSRRGHELVHSFDWAHIGRKFAMEMTAAIKRRADGST